ncbi:MAG: 50S ribosome-binding GTPase [Oscillospiraceae bacterium]|jgi:predicted GTPase|nr:50S ribosome-binding GTPase [Oscillospiraceae bacterium]
MHESTQNSATTNTPRRSIYDVMEAAINNSEMTDEAKNRRLSELLKFRGQSTNIMVVGASGTGKSSTINSIFDLSIAKVGVGVDPETTEIAKYEFDNLTIWDTPGLGDSTDADKRNARAIVDKLSEVGADGAMLIDLVLVVVEASSKDLRTTYDLISKVIFPCLGKENGNRILVGINQADVAMKGNHWNYETNEPDDVLRDFLDKKTASVKARIAETTGLDVEPICYCAGYTDDDGVQRRAYNLAKLLWGVLRVMPKEKRLAVADTLRNDGAMWEDSDEDEDYTEGVRESLFDAWDYIEICMSDGVDIGNAILGLPGAVVGGIIGLVFGTIKGAVHKLFKIEEPNYPEYDEGENDDDADDDDDDSDEDDSGNPFEKILRIFNGK